MKKGFYYKSINKIKINYKEWEKFEIRKCSTVGRNLDEYKDNYFYIVNILVYNFILIQSLKCVGYRKMKLKYFYL